MGELSKETAFQTLDLYHSQGGNFIDTANNYQDDEIEEWLGEWLSTHKNLTQVQNALSEEHILGAPESNVGVKHAQELSP
jgi:predicted aldo/keto reductase-like oxidoreductase